VRRTRLDDLSLTGFGAAALTTVWAVVYGGHDLNAKAVRRYTSDTTSYLTWKSGLLIVDVLPINFGVNWQETEESSLRSHIFDLDGFMLHSFQYTAIGKLSLSFERP
jgi:hypothetical protein